MSDPVPAVAQVVLRALCVLMAGSPYDRLPQGLLPQTIDVRILYGGGCMEEFSPQLS